jgi:hypothetical protein
MLPGNLGKYGKISCNFAVWFSMFLCLVGYMIVVEDAISNVLPAKALEYMTRPIIGSLFSLLLIPVCFLPMRYVRPSAAHARPSPLVPCRAAWRGAAPCHAATQCRAVRSPRARPKR